MDPKKKSDELLFAYQDLVHQPHKRKDNSSKGVATNIDMDGINLDQIDKEKLAAELILANIERDFQTGEREKRAAELVVANLERAFQNEEKDKRAAELIIANKELAFQNEEKEKRAAELIIANKELAFQNLEKEKRAAELLLANKELIFQNEEKEKRAAELAIANKELIFQNREKEKRAAELVIANRELALQNQERELNKRKDEFIAIASHELKTPLTSVSAYLQFLERSLVGDTNRKYIDKALRQVDKLSQLISDLLDVSKIEAGKLTLNYSSFDICELTNEVIEIINFGGQPHLIESSFPVTSLMVNADKQRIEQVIINLLSNAIKYSPHANRILISVSQTEANIVVSVQDFGLGIKEEEQLHVFSRFYRAGGVAQKISGLGIGLYICDDIISRHNGILGVESKLGTGSTFSFKIPQSI